jgi:hypothetical protein
MPEISLVFARGSRILHRCEDESSKKRLDANAGDGDRADRRMLAGGVVSDWGAVLFGAEGISRRDEGNARVG